MDEATCRSATTLLNYNKRQLQDVSCLESSDENSCGCILELHLCFNYISDVPVATLALYSRLTYLSLACNNLTSVPPSLSVSCPQLKTLRAPNNRISSLRNLEGLENLEYLDLRYNRISCLDNLLSLTRLKELTVSDNMIQSVCWPQVPCLPTLTFLGIYGNQLTDFENTVHHLRQKAGNLKRLNIGCNRFCADRQLSLQSALLTMKHLSSVQTGKLILNLGQLFSSPLEKSCDSGENLEGELDIICRDFARGQDDRRLRTVAKMLLKLKLNFPLLESVDENALPRS